MAAIEKICEYSGEYPGSAMYGYKRDHIQIIPIVRSEFRGKLHTLYIEKEPSEYQMFWTKRVYSSIEPSELHNHVMVIDGKLHSTRTYAKVKLLKEYTYMLYVPDMQGRVDGCYLNYSTNLKSVKRRLKRMLRCKKLNIVYVQDVDQLIADIHLKSNCLEVIHGTDSSMES
jgi:hypothetical protein